ncbi:uncharacterized protein N7500_000941 [Penicillium coprophilum]|uniref:uncharacterized protein n=1 Tax=Penicillium coprophilum TaxID=36646 RepID=UPI0023A35C79|nr:uncharacterized protein N7500_000941 [Penicillium coprophilum]KAJ5178242.1 hypothetical protein N7500_000941 [Penicillium coprophilum]
MLSPSIMIAACCLSTPTLASTWSSSIAALPNNLAETPAAVTDYASQWAKSLASTIETIYRPETCNMMSGISKDMKWPWRSADSDCGIEAQRDAMSGAVKHYMASEDNRDHCQEDCNTKCIRLEAGSSRDGSLKLAPVDGLDEEAYCRSTLIFDS